MAACNDDMIININYHSMGYKVLAFMESEYTNNLLVVLISNIIFSMIKAFAKISQGQILQ